MTISFFGATSNPTDNAALDDASPRPITPPGSMVAGDLVYLLALVHSSAQSLAISNTGGQSWISETLLQGQGAISLRLFWCRFNGTWSANPSVVTGQTGLGLSLFMGVWRPTTGSNTWAV